MRVRRRCAAAGFGEAADIAEAVLLDSGREIHSGHELVVDGGVSTSVMATSPRMTTTRRLILVGGIFHDFPSLKGYSG